MNEETIGPICVTAILVTLFVCIAFVLKGSGGSNVDDRIHRLEAKIDRIHNVIVGPQH
jgi:hypothetical protein